MSGRKDDPDLAPDAALAVEHTPEREAEQLAHLGGEKDEIDDFDPTGLDDGSDFDPNAAPAASPSNEDDNGEDDDGEPEVEEGSEEEQTADDSGESGEEDADVEDEAEGDDDGESSEAAERKAQGIPKHRFDEVNERRKAAEKENERLRAELEASKPPEKKEEPFDFDAAETEYQNLLLDGDTDAALAKRREIRAAEHAAWKAEAKSETRSDLDTEADTQELLSLSREAEEMFDVFNPESDSYNQAILDKVLVIMGGYQVKYPDMSRADAFVAGLADVAEMYDLMPPEEGEADTTPKPTGKPKTDPKKAKVRDKAHQPVGNQGGASAEAGAVVPNIENMSDEELDALPEKTLARLRGDFI